MKLLARGHEAAKKESGKSVGSTYVIRAPVGYISVQFDLPTLFPGSPIGPIPLGFK
jgi:hypothetical protein